jgi:two-component sensor histidine kinase/CheY-like chemotaxis protein
MRAIFIDDDADARTLAARAVTREFPGIDAVEVADMEGLYEALEGGPADLVVTDYRLQFSTGLEVLRAVRERFPGCVVVMFTGTGTEEVAVEAMKAGLDDYVIKRRNHLPRLVASVRAALDRARSRDALRAAEGERAAALEERALLLEELYHRVHNNLQIAISFVAFAGRAFADPAVRRAFDDTADRIRSMTLLQERLYRSRELHRVDLGAHLGELAAELGARHGGTQGAGGAEGGAAGSAGAERLAAGLVPLDMPIDRAAPLALLANELLLAALARLPGDAPPAGALGGPRLRLDLAASGGRAEIRVALDGVAPSPLLPEGSLSAQIAARLAEQAGATICPLDGETSTGAAVAFSV